MKRLFSVLLIAAMLIGALVSCKNDEKKNGALCDQFYDETNVVTNLVRMNITYLDANGKKQTGDIVVELNPTAAPITVKNFQTLVSEDFYDGLIFHRVIKDFMIQGGDPKGNGTGGSSNTIKGEFSANGISNPIKHTRGVISMARSNANDSASSQFFIVHQTSPHLDGNYAAFGEVVFGIEMVDAIAAVATDRNDKPLNQVTINYMTFVVPKGETPTTEAPSEKDEQKNGALCDQFYDETNVVTNLVRMNITYLDANGKKQTGDIVVELNPTAAPITVKNFQTLVSEDFYDGLIFHRVIKDFMIQGGDPKGNGTGGSSNTIKGEFSANGITNPIKHTRGVISMARRGDSFDSASSQFFIVHQTSPHLDGNYAAFGEVVFGIEMVDAIAAVATDRNDKPLNQVTINYMTFVVPKGETPTTEAPTTEAPTMAPTEEPTTSAQ